MELKCIKSELKPNQYLVDMLERILKEAKNGTLRSICAGGEYNNGDSGTFHVMDKGANPYQMMGLLTAEIQIILRAHEIIEDHIEIV